MRRVDNNQNPSMLDVFETVLTLSLVALQESYARNDWPHLCKTVEAEGRRMFRAGLRLRYPCEVSTHEIDLEHRYGREVFDRSLNVTGKQSYELTAETVVRELRRAFELGCMGNHSFTKSNTFLREATEVGFVVDGSWRNACYEHGIAIVKDGNRLTFRTLTEACAYVKGYKASLSDPRLCCIRTLSGRPCRWEGPGVATGVEQMSSPEHHPLANILDRQHSRSPIEWDRWRDVRVRTLTTRANVSLVYYP